jgi:hypothetical protein
MALTHNHTSSVAIAASFIAHHIQGVTETICKRTADDCSTVERHLIVGQVHLPTQLLPCVLSSSDGGTPLDWTLHCPKRASVN